MANFVSPFEKWGAEGVVSDPHDTITKVVFDMLEHFYSLGNPRSPCTVLGLYYNTTKFRPTTNLHPMTANLTALIFERFVGGRIFVVWTVVQWRDGMKLNGLTFRVLNNFMLEKMSFLGLIFRCNRCAVQCKKYKDTKEVSCLEVFFWGHVSMQKT